MRNALNALLIYKCRLWIGIWHGFRCYSPLSSRTSSPTGAPWPTWIPSAGRYSGNSAVSASCALARGTTLSPAYRGYACRCLYVAASRIWWRRRSACCACQKLFPARLCSCLRVATCSCTRMRPHSPHLHASCWVIAFRWPRSISQQRDDVVPLRWQGPSFWGRSRTFQAPLHQHAHALHHVTTPHCFAGEG